MRPVAELILWHSVKRCLKRCQPFVIAVTGSIAKTSTKRAIGKMLDGLFPDQVLVGYGNLNTYLGVPLAILGFRIDFYRQRISWQWSFILIWAYLKSFWFSLPRYLVLEFGADKPGDIEQLAKQIKTDVAVLTWVGPAHLANYNSIADIACEKAAIFSSLKDKGFAVINANDRFKTLYYKRTGQHPVIEVDCEKEDIATSFAREIGLAMGLNKIKVETALKSFQQESSRLMRRRLPTVELLDDSYNANPSSMEAALAVFKKMPRPRVAILGEMRELGRDEVKFHRQVGRLARQEANLVVGVGELAKHYQPNFWYSSSQEAANHLADFINGGESVLVKGSRAIKMEVIIKALEEFSGGLSKK